MKKIIPSYNIVSFGKKTENFAISLQEKTIGTFLNTTPEYIKKGSIVFLHCRSFIWAMATVVSDYYYDEKPIWKDKVYPHRFKIDVFKITTLSINLVNDHYNDRLRESYGPCWAFKFIFAPKPLPTSIGIDLYNDLNSRSDASADEILEALSKLNKKRK